MPIKLPNLDDRTFADLVAEANTLIPVHAPEWTNHNESDPGITLVELFAYLTEMQIYRLNRVTDANVCAFLGLIDGVERKPSTQSTGMITRVKEGTEVALRDEVRNVVLKLRQQDRAVTREDFERLALAADRRVSRSYCVPRTNLKSETPYETADAHVSVVIVPIEVLFDRVFWFDGTTFGDLTNISAGVEKAIPLWTPAATADARLYIGSSNVFESLAFELVATGKGYTLAFEYFNGTVWVQLTRDDHKLTDNTSNLSDAGAVTFVPPTDWQQLEINHWSGYWLRISSTAVPDSPARAIRIFQNLNPGPPSSPTRIFQDLIETVGQYLEPRRLLTTRVHIVGPRFMTLGVNVALHLKPGAVADTVHDEAVKTLINFFDSQAWPFGRNVYVSEIYRLLDQVPGVDHITKVKVKTKDGGVKGKEIITTDDAARKILQNTELVAIKLYPDEVVNFSVEKSDIGTEPPPAAKFET